MLGGFSDSNLGSWLFWLQFLGVAGALGVIVSVLGMHMVSAEISTRAAKRAVPVVTTAAPSIRAAPPAGGVPVAPESARVPAAPEVASAHAAPETSGVPAAPEAASAAPTPEVASAHAAAETGSVPAAPEAATAAAAPEVASAHAAPETGGVPAASEAATVAPAPEVASAPTTPEAGSVPAAPETASVPAAPEAAGAAPAPAVVQAPAEKSEPKPDNEPPPPAPREISESQRTVFIGELDSAPKRPIPVVIFDQDPEIQSYADQIRVMLVLAGYDCGPTVKTNTVPSVSPTGVMIVVKDPARAPAFAGAIQNAFKAIGIDALGAKDEDFQDNQAAVVVGRRAN